MHHAAAPSSPCLSPSPSVASRLTLATVPRQRAPHEAMPGPVTTGDGVAAVTAEPAGAESGEAEVVPPLPARATAERPLGGEAPGAVVRVRRVTGDDVLARRLVDLGFWPGTRVQVVRRAPLGDPIQYALRGFRIALRRSEAARVLVADDEAA